MKKSRDFYDKELTFFLMTVLSGVCVGVFVLASLDIFARLSVSARPLSIVGAFTVLLLICLIYWVVKVIKSDADKRVLAWLMLFVCLIGSAACVHSNIRNFSLMRITKATERITKGEAEIVAGGIRDVLHNLRNGNNYVQLIYEVSGDEVVSDPATGEAELVEGETLFFAVLYNDKGEFILQDSKDEYTTVVGLPGGTLIDYSSAGVALTRGVDPMALGELLANAVYEKKSGFRVEAMTSEALDGYYGVGFSEFAQGYVLTAEGSKVVRGLYVQANGESYGETIDALLKSYKEQGLGEPKMTMDYLTDGVNTLAALRLGAEGVDDRILWYLAGSAEVASWSLPDEWYTYDFSDAEQNSALLESLMSDITELLGDTELTDDGLSVDDAPSASEDVPIEAFGS